MVGYCVYLIIHDIGGGKTTFSLKMEDIVRAERKKVAVEWLRLRHRDILIIENYLLKKKKQ